MKTKTYYLGVTLLLLTLCALLYALVAMEARALCAAASLLYLYFVAVEDEVSSPLTDCIQYLKKYGDGWSDVCIYTSRIAGPFEELRSATRR